MSKPVETGSKAPDYTRVTVDAHIYPGTELELHRSEFDQSPAMRVSDRLTLYFQDDATARKFAEALLALLVREVSHE